MGAAVQRLGRGSYRVVTIVVVVIPVVVVMLAVVMDTQTRRTMPCRQIDPNTKIDAILIARVEL